MSEFWERKIKTYFKFMDYNGDGVITEEDFEMMGIRFAETQNADAEKKEKLVNAFRDVWTLWTTGAEGDEKQSLSLSAFIKSFRIQSQDPTECKKMATAAARIMYDLMDVNKDGYLQEDEHRKFFEAVGIPDSSFAKEAFAAIDINHDGLLSFEEFVTGYCEFLFSDDESNPYNSFFGPLV